MSFRICSHFFPHFSLHAQKIKILLLFDQQIRSIVLHTLSLPPVWTPSLVIYYHNGAEWNLPHRSTSLPEEYSEYILSVYLTDYRDVDHSIKTELAFIASTERTELLLCCSKPVTTCELHQVGEIPVLATLGLHTVSSSTLVWVNINDVNWWTQQFKNCNQYEN